MAIEKLEEEKAAKSTDIKERFAAAKGQGFDPKVMRQVIKLRKQDREERETQDQIRDLYLSALGELPDFERADA